MFILVQHQITDPTRFWSGAQQEMSNLPSHLKLHHSFPTPDGSRAACVWEAPSVDALKSYIEPAVGGVSRNEYFEIANKEGIALPQSVIAKAAGR
jgi:hypothetical protein